MKTFWDIEQEKTWNIYVLFALLILIYFVPIFIIWMVIKYIIHFRNSLNNIEVPFTILGIDTVVVLFLAAIASLIHWYYSNKYVIRKILGLLDAQRPDRDDRYHNIFENIVDEMETSAGGVCVERYVIPTGAMNAFALADIGGRKVIGVTEGLLSRLKRDELQAVVAHEMAHIISNDSLQTTTICSMFGLYSEALAHFSASMMKSKTRSAPFTGEQRPAASGGLIAFPIVFLLFVTDALGTILNMFISREKEYRADANAVKYSRNPLALASALYKIGMHWRGAGYGGEYLAPIFILRPAFNQLDEEEHLAATLFSTHPPLVKRLQIILGLAHADIAQISQEVKKKARIKKESEVIESASKFLAQHDGKWQGPYTINQLISFDWLKPTTKLRIADSQETILTGDIPQLNDFFQKEDTPVWKIRRLCPDCREWLIVREYEGLYVWYCAFCNGIMVPEDRLPRIFVRRDKGFTERVMRIAKLLTESTSKKKPRFRIIINASHPRPCPKCGNDMVHKFYSYAYHVEIDRCPVCKIVWFDVDELEILQCAIELAEGIDNISGSGDY